MAFLVGALGAEDADGPGVRSKCEVSSQRGVGGGEVKANFNCWKGRSQLEKDPDGFNHRGWGSAAPRLLPAETGAKPKTVGFPFSGRSRLVSCHPLVSRHPLVSCHPLVSSCPRWPRGRAGGGSEWRRGAARWRRSPGAGGRGGDPGALGPDLGPDPVPACLVECTSRAPYTGAGCAAKGERTCSWPPVSLRHYPNDLRIHDFIEKYQIYL